MSDLYKVKFGSETKNLDVHPDDTIDTLKRKIIRVFDSNVSYDSIYIYCIQERTYVPEQLYRELSQNGKMEVTYDRLQQFLLNFDDPDMLDKLERKDIYTIGDLYDLRLNTKHLMKVVVGQHFSGNKSTNYPYTVNPLDVKRDSDIDEFLVEHAASMVTTQNGDLVMNIGKIHENTFHLLTGETIFKHFKDMGNAKVADIYLPFLAKRKIHTLDELEKQREKLLEENKRLLSANVERGFESVDLLYTMYKNHRYPTLESGIKEIDFFLHQSLNMIIPLEQLFKILHASKHIPFVKYNPGFRRENLLRLYTEEQTFNGTKIPFLSKAMIIKLIKAVGKNKTISLYLDANIVCTIFESGSARILYEQDTVKSLDEIQETMQILVNPILSDIKKYVEKSGFTYSLFTNFQEENTEIVSVKYESKVKLEERFIIQPFMSCISTIFNVSQDVIGKEGGIVARYKRVAYYNEMNAIDSFIRDVINRGNQRDSVIEKIKDNFGMTRDEAEAKFIAFVNEIEVEQGIFQNRKLRIKDNPGFATSFVMEKFTTNMVITIEGINSVDYLDVIPIYLSSIVEMVQGKQSDIVKPICSKKPILEEKPVEEIVAPGEKPYGENETPVITQAQELNFDDEGDDDMLDMLLGSDDEEEEEDDDETMGGGGGGEKASASVMRDITGMSLANPNYFSKRMEDRDPSLFLKKKTGKFNAYSRMCPSNIRRQPVILTEAEKERIDREHPGSYSHSIKYGSDPENPYHYICPRYWCIPENTSLSEEEVKAGACGGVDAIIPFNAKKVPAGKTIYEFGADPSDPSAHAYKEYYDEDGNYVTHHPGFIPGNKHPDGKCMPCCFKSWDAKEQVRRREECSQDKGESKVSAVKKRRQGDTQKDYIKGEEKYPLEPDRWGYMPVQLQMFFNEDVKNVQVSAINPILKDNAITLLRHGVENHPTQSFIACIADIFSDYSNEDIKVRMDRKLKALRKDLKTLRKGESSAKSEKEAERITREIQKLQAKPSIKEMKSIIMKMITIDNYTNYQNGNLVTEFYDPARHNSDVSIDKYQDSLLYKNLDTTDEAQVEYFEKIIVSFEKFMAFLSDDEVIIDYQYLWDIICMPNPALFPNGINLVIFEIPEDDVTSNVEIICPTNHYSNVIFNDKRLTLILVKRDNFFEPIYLYDNLKKNVSRFMFREQTLVGKPNIKMGLSTVREFLTSKCRPLNSMPKIYTFEENVTLDKALAKLEKHITKVGAITVNYNGKAIGVHVVLKDGSKGFVPTYPSNYEVTESVAIIFMDDEKQWQNYAKTVAFLNKIHKLTKLPCRPICKVVEDNMVVGVITKTNQVVPINTPERKPDDDLGECDTSYEDNIDKTMIMSKAVDTQRNKFLKALKMEEDSYRSFRNLARIELNRYKNHTLKKELLDVIEKVNKDSLDAYSDALYAIVALLHKLLKRMVEFVTKPDLENHKYPIKNLTTGKSNETWYFLRLADEALRFQRIKLFLFEKEKYLSFGEVLYQVNKDEILLLESMITSEYFEDMKAFKRNKYVSFNTYDTAQPLITVPYSEKINVEKCAIKTSKVSGKYITKIFSKDYSIMNFGDSKKESRTPVCSFEMIMTILKNEGKEMSKRDIQQILAEKYSEYPRDVILKILFNEGKEQWVKMIRGEKLELNEFIYSEHYYLTFLDLWMLASLFDVPIIFFGQYDMNVNKNKVFATTTKAKGYYLVRTFSPRQNTIPKYSMIVSPTKEIKIPLPEILSKKELFTAFVVKSADGKSFVKPKKPIVHSINEYIQNYNKINK